MNHRKKTVWKAACLAMVLLTAGAAGAAPSDKISYQGFLTDASGTPIDASVNMAAGFYNVSGGGTSLYAESHAAVTVSEGQFNLLLGAGTPTSGTWAGLDFTQALWIEITAGSETLSPRIPMSSVSYSRYAFTVAEGSVSASKLNGSPGNGTAGQFLSSNGSGGFSWASGVSAAEVGGGSVDNTEFGYLDGVTASIQTQLNAKGAGDMLKADNLSGLASYPTARTNLGLGGLATLNSVSSAEITDGTIADADVSGTAAIADTKLATISTSGKVSNSATTAASANTVNAIVARDASGNFSAGTSILSGLAVTGGSPAAGKVLTSDASGNATWQAAGAVTGIFEKNGTVVRGSTAGGVGYANDDFVFGSPQLANDGDTNHDARMFFDKSKGAFRAGIALTQWDDAKVGNLSTAMGSNTTASGPISTAMGYSSKASGSHSTAIGHSTEASGGYSTAMGYSSKASGDYSTAIGNFTIASEVGSMAMGSATNASGLDSTAMGSNTTAGGNYSTAMGHKAKATHNGTLIWADYTNADFNSAAANEFAVRAGGGVRFADSTGANKITFNTSTGNAALTSLTISGGTPAAGKVLTSSDASGNATWQTASGGLTSVTGTAPIVSSGGTSLAISLGTVPIAKGGTGVTSLAAGHLSSNGTAVTSSATIPTADISGTLTDAQVADNLTINGGTVDNSIIGGTTPAAGAFTTLKVTGGTPAAGKVLTSSDASGTAAWQGAAFEKTGNLIRATNGFADYENDDFVFGSPQLADDGDVNHRSRMFFDKNKGAFRAGYMTGMHWDDGSVGLYSIATGRDTIASGDYSTAIGAGTTASGDYSTAMGDSTAASGDYSTAMGRDTTASGIVSTSMGYCTTAQSFASLVIGQFNTVSGSAGSWVAADPVFVIGNGTSVAAPSDAFVVYKNGSISSSTGASLTAGGTWTNSSDRNAKENFEEVNTREILSALVNIPVETWNYKTQEDSIRHIGPMAQDFYSAFKVGENDKTITTVDADGVALAAIQGLNSIVEEQKAVIAQQQATIDNLKARLESLEAKIGK